MLKWLAAGACACLLMPGGANALTCPAYPNILTNGSTADANQVMADFNSILACADNNLAPNASPHLTGNVTIAAPSTGLALDSAGIGRFQSPNAGSTGAVVIRDAPGNPQAAYLQFVNSANSSQLGFIRGLNASGLELAGGNIGVNTGSPTLNFYVNGSAGGTQAWSSSSDARLKRNVVTITNALGLVEHLRGVRFEWLAVSERKAGKDLTLPIGEKEIGFVAQEVETVVPEAVTRPASGSNGTYGVKEGSLVPLLVEAIKEQQTQIDQLRAEIASMKAKQ
ncbi:MAG: tail fiber domain-containing protein [Caulobacteraceae bacterium]|nr:tail fiber domain-containing protein [Caulobacteraceae bacterium]